MRANLDIWSFQLNAAEMAQVKFEMTNNDQKGKGPFVAAHGEYCSQRYVFTAELQHASES